jgi:hypothetical protein
MEEDKTQVVSLRLSEETYGKLKLYAESKGRSVSDVLRLAIEELLEKEASPAPGPPAVAVEPLAPCAQAVPAEVAELRCKVESLATGQEATRRYIEGLAWRLNEVQATVNKIMVLMAPGLPPPGPVPFPGFPGPPWVTLSEPGGGAAGEAS